MMNVNKAQKQCKFLHCLKRQTNVPSSLEHRMIGELTLDITQILIKKKIKITKITNLY